MTSQDVSILADELEVIGRWHEHKRDSMPWMESGNQNTEASWHYAAAQTCFASANALYQLARSL